MGCVGLLLFFVSTVCTVLPSSLCFNMDFGGLTLLNLEDSSVSESLGDLKIDLGCTLLSLGMSVLCLKMGLTAVASEVVLVSGSVSL